jgi:hypothetical protein
MIDLELSQPEDGLLLLLRGLLLVLLHLFVPLGHTPGVWPAQGRTVGPSTGRLQLLPILTIGPCPQPGTHAHDQASAPEAVLLRAGGQTAALLPQLLRDGPDVIRLKSAAAANVADAQVVGLPRVLVHVPPEIKKTYNK